MTRTVADVTNRAKSILKDKVDPRRYPDTDILDCINDALIEVRRVRPDLFIKKKFRVAPLVTDTDVLPVEDFVFNVIVYWVCGTLMLRDDEFAVDGRANGMLSKATAQLLACAA